LTVFILALLQLFEPETGTAISSSHTVVLGRNAGQGFQDIAELLLTDGSDTNNEMIATGNMLSNTCSVRLNPSLLAG
jgi:hypothetical protein